MKLFVRFRNVYLYATWYISTLIRRRFPTKQKSEDDLAWEKEERERELDLARKHYWMYIFGKLEPFIIWPGFVFFLAEPIIKVLAPLPVFFLIRAWEGGMIGLLIGSYLHLKWQKRMTFWWRNEAMTILNKINEAIGHSVVGDRQVN